MSRLIIPNNISLRNIDTIFTNNIFDFSDKDVEIVFPEFISMHPVGLAFYAAMVDCFRANGCRITGNINEIAQKETGGIPLTKIFTNEDLNSFIKTIDPIFHTNKENSRVIKHVFSELLRNVIIQNKCQKVSERLLQKDKIWMKYQFIPIVGASPGIKKSQKRFATK
jgi:hypothetical protein